MQGQDSVEVLGGIFVTIGDFEFQNRRRVDDATVALAEATGAGRSGLLAKGEVVIQRGRWADGDMGRRRRRRRRRRRGQEVDGGGDGGARRGLFGAEVTPRGRRGVDGDGRAMPGIGVAGVRVGSRGRRRVVPEDGGGRLAQAVLGRHRVRLRGTRFVGGRVVAPGRSMVGMRQAWQGGDGGWRRLGQKLGDGHGPAHVRCLGERRRRFGTRGGGLEGRQVERRQRAAVMTVRGAWRADGRQGGACCSFRAAEERVRGQSREP